MQIVTNQTSQCKTRDRGLVFLHVFNLGHLSQPKMELTVGEGGWTNSSEQKVEKPGERS